MEQSGTELEVEKASLKALSEEPLPVVSTQEVLSLSEPSDAECGLLPLEAISAATSGDHKTPISPAVPVQSFPVILNEADVSSVSNTISYQPSLFADEENLPVVQEAQLSPLESDTSLVVPRSVADSSLQSANTVLSARESRSSPMKGECVIRDDERSQPILNQTSGDLGSSKREQDVESDEKMDSEPSPIVPTKSSNEGKISEMEVEVVKPSSNGQISSQQEKPSRKSSESPVNITQSTLTLETSGTDHLPEKTVKRGTEVECLPERHAKRKRNNDVMFSVPETVEAVLCSTAEIVIVLAGMAQIRAGRPFTSLEKDLAAVAYQSIASLVSKLAPNALVSKEALETMIRDLDLKRMAQTRKEDQARAKALAEAEAVAKAKASKAEAVAKLKAEELVKMKTEAEVEERKQAALRAAAAAVAKSPIKDVKSIDSLPPPATPSGQSAPAMPPPVELKISSPTPVTPPSIQTQAPVHACDVSQSEAVPEKSLVDNSPSQQSSKTPLGKPPKVRNRIKKDLAAPTLLSPNYLEYIQSQVPEPQKAQVTHKQLCLAVQQFIQEQMPHASQTLQAIPPSYINTPTPCQLCKLVAKDTGTVMVCDSCDQLFHVKCVQPNNHTKGVPKGDWNCPECLSGGRSYREKYGLYRRGSVNGVKLWAPHDSSEDDVLISSSGTGSSGRQSGLNSNLKMQGKLTVDVETSSHVIKDERSVGNYGGSPHLIVHLVNEPSPRTNEPVPDSSLAHVGGENIGGSLVSGSQLKLSSRPGSGDSRTGEQSGNARPCSRENEGDVSENAAEASGSQVEKTERSAENEAADIPSNLPGKQIEVPLIMEWVGESTRTVEGKTYYRSCRVGGQTYSLSDCALFRPETPDVPPYIARLQVLWEDPSTSHKWVRVSWCYYPSDIPLAMGRPGRAEPDEVYESNHCDNNLVGSIQGPCLVLPPRKYRKELERRKELQKRGSIRETFPPVFLSRWLYDAPKGMFKPVTE